MMKNIIYLSLILSSFTVSAGEFDSESFQNDMRDAADYFSYGLDDEPQPTQPAAKKREMKVPKKEEVGFRDLEQVYFDEVKTKASGTKKESFSKKPKRKRSRQ